MRIALLLLLIFYGTPAFLQPVGKRSSVPLTAGKPFNLRTTTLTELCNNNIDDDGNGLIDCKDYSCYFKQGDATCACYPMNLIWIGDAVGGLYWIDVNTQIEKKVGNMPSVMNDITWSPQGKLYGMNGDGIFQIDPATAQANFLFTIPGYIPSNALVTDAAGNLYMTAMGGGAEYIIKYNIFNNAVARIANITAAGVTSGGDLAFSGGTLFLACNNNKIAKINITTGVVLVSNIVGLPVTTQIFGIVAAAGSELFISDVNRLYSLDTASYRATLAYTCSTTGLFIYGMANYNDFCNAPRVCNATVKIDIQSAPPYCTRTGIKLNAEGKGVSGSTGYTWFLPDGTQSNTQSLIAQESGKYTVRYHTIPDTCEAWDTIAVHLMQTPSANLGKDTSYCRGSYVTLESLNNTDVIQWLWSNGSVTQKISVNQSGAYWVQLSNGCGISKDTVVVSQIDPPEVELGNNLELCPGTHVYVKNYLSKKPIDRYLWSDGSSSDSLKVTLGGMYWLESSNTCGKVRDSIIVHMNDSCICNPVYPAIELGNDRQLCKFDTLVLGNAMHSNLFRYSWNDGSNKKFLVVENPGRYWVNVSTFCGAVSDTILVTSKLAGCECNLYVPNAFSPVASSTNQRFRLISNCFLRGEIFIYNRWGQLIYHTANIQSGWDGRFNGELQPPGTYIFQVRYHFNNRPGNYTEKGSFILVR